MSDADDSKDSKLPQGVPGGLAIRAVMNAVADAIPFAGGMLSAASAAWSEREQAKINEVLEQWLQMLEMELAEKAQTILEIMARLNMEDEKVSERIASPEYRSLLRKAFRDWPGGESERKRELVRNILAHAADAALTSDDVVRLFIQWLTLYSELHFTVIGAIYNDEGVTRARIWEKVGKEEVREDSSEADLFRLLIRDLSTGGIVRQHREKDYGGNFLRKRAQRRRKAVAVASTMESAFEDSKGYELTELGRQFVHYAMTDLPTRIEFHPKGEPDITAEVSETA